LRQGRFTLDIRKKKFSQRVVSHWNRLPGEAEVFKKHSDAVLRNVV